MSLEGKRPQREDVAENEDAAGPEGRSASDFAELFEVHHLPAYRLALLLSGGETTTAEDAVSEAFARRGDRALDGHDHGDGEGPPLARAPTTSSATGRGDVIDEPIDGDFDAELNAELDGLVRDVRPSAMLRSRAERRLEQRGPARSPIVWGSIAAAVIAIAALLVASPDHGPSQRVAASGQATTTTMAGVLTPVPGAQESPVPTTPASTAPTTTTRPKSNPAATASTTTTTIYTGPVTEFALPRAASNPYNITAGPDGNVWFTESQGDPGIWGTGTLTDGSSGGAPPTASSKIGRITPSGTITEFTPPTASASLQGITAGPDGNLWFTETIGTGQSATGKIGRITPSGTTIEYPIPTQNSTPSAITKGPDGALWFTETIGGSQTQPGKIGRITTSGAFSEYAVKGDPYYITSGPDGNLWWTDFVSRVIGRITPAGSSLPNYPAPHRPLGIVTGPDGNIWFVDGGEGPNAIGRITPAGVFTSYPVATSEPVEIVAGADGNIWFTEGAADKIGRITTAGTVTEFAARTPNSLPWGITTGPDKNIWFTELSANNIGRLDLASLSGG